MHPTRIRALGALQSFMHNRRTRLTLLLPRATHAALVCAGLLAGTPLTAAIAVQDRVELSIAHQDFDVKDNLAPLGLSGLHLKQNIIAFKLRVAGDAVLDSDLLMPQVAFGLQYKESDAGALSPSLYGPLGAKDSGTDVYISATKLFLASGVLVNGTLRATKANQNGLLGFGGAQSDRYKLQPEVSVAKLLSKNVAIGAEYRAKPDNLNRSARHHGAGA